MKKKIKCNLLQVEAFAKAPICDKKTCYGNKTYACLEEKTTAHGFEHKIVEKPYEITPAYVKSFSSCDYRKDINSALCATPRGKNLGDVTEIQKLINADMETAHALYGKLKDVFEKAQTQNETQTNTNTEVNANA